MTTRPAIASSDDACADLAGHQAFWSGRDYHETAALGEWQARGWLTAAREARRICQEHETYLKQRTTIRDALTASIAAIRNLVPVKARPTQRRLADDALLQANTAWAYCAPDDVAAKAPEHKS